MDHGSQDSEDETGGIQNILMDDATLEKAAASLFQRFPIPIARLSASSVITTAKSVGVDLNEQLAEYIGDKAMKELRYAILLSTQFNRHERAPGLRESDFKKAITLINCVESDNIEETQIPMPTASQQNKIQEQPTPTSNPQIFLHRFSPDEETDENPTNNINVFDEIKTSQESAQINEEEEGWQDYPSNTTSSGDKESPGDSSEGSAGTRGNTNQEQGYEGPDSDERENHSDNNDMDFDSKMLPDSCDNIENEIGDEFLDEIDDQKCEHSDYTIHQVTLSS